MVDNDAGILTIFGSCANGTHVLASDAEMMRLSWAAVVIRGRPGCERLFGVLQSFKRARKSVIVVRGMPVSPAISA